MFPTCQLRTGFLYLLVLLVIPLAQQGNASSWTGVLRDASRNPVASAKIEIRAVNGHPIRDATTAADGTFLISGITAGAYHISVAYHQRVWSASKSVTLPEDDTISASLQLFSTTQEVLVQTSQKSQSNRSVRPRRIRASQWRRAPIRQQRLKPA